LLAPCFSRRPRRVLCGGRIGLTGNTRKSLILQILEFYGHPNRSGTTLQVASSALDCVLQCETQLIIIDDKQFLNLNRRDGREVSNTLKSVANDFPSTFIFVGVAVEDPGLFREGLEPGESAAAPLGRRWTRLEIPAFQIFEEQHREGAGGSLFDFETDAWACEVTERIGAEDSELARVLARVIAELAA
jgi:hypothetical protein